MTSKSSLTRPSERLLRRWSSPMTAIITKKQVEAAFKRFATTFPAPNGQRWILESNNPGDGKRRYGVYSVNIDQAKGSAYFQPLAGTNWGSSREAHDALHTMCRAVSYLNWLKYTEPQHQTEDK